MADLGDSSSDWSAGCTWVAVMSEWECRREMGSALAVSTGMGVVEAVSTEMASDVVATWIVAGF